MQTKDPAAYLWVARDSTYEAAGCLTLVSGLEIERALTAVGADLSRQSGTSTGFAAEGMAAISAVSVLGEDAAVVLVEENGYEGSRPEVLKALSKKGAAASAFWNVNGVVRFGCARRGKVVYTAELPDDDAGQVPRILRKLVSAAEAEDADPLPIAVAMAVTFTGIELPDTEELSRPSRFHPISHPVLGLPVTAEELLGLQYPTPELVGAARAASPEACRRLARWAALDAIDRAGLRDYPAITQVVDQFENAVGPVALDPGFFDLKNQVSRELDMANAASDVASNEVFTTNEEKARLHAEERAWGRRHWAVQALLYTAVNDPVTAALGSTYCATILHGLGSDAAARFHQQALDVLV